MGVKLKGPNKTWELSLKIGRSSAHWMNLEEQGVMFGRIRILGPKIISLVEGHR